MAQPKLLKSIYLAKQALSGFLKSDYSSNNSKLEQVPKMFSYFPTTNNRYSLCGIWITH